MLNDELSSLRSRANSYDSVKNFFNTNARVEPYWNEVREQCIRDNCQSVPTMMILTIEKLLDEIDNLEEENVSLEKQLERKQYIIDHELSSGYSNPED